MAEIGTRHTPARILITFSAFLNKRKRVENGFVRENTPYTTFYVLSPVSTACMDHLEEGEGLICCIYS